MTYKWMGAILIITGCGGFGFSMASNYRKEVKTFQQLIHILHFMECELQYRLTPLPELCRLAGREGKGIVRDIFLNLSEELQRQYAPDVCSCMAEALKKNPGLPVRLRNQLLRLGHSLGRFELSGQVQGLQAVRTVCEEEVSRLNEGRENRLRSYRTLGLCAGTALVILFA